MNCSLVFRLILVLVLIAAPLLAQQNVQPQVPTLPPGMSASNLPPSPPWVPHPIRDDDAVKVVQASISAMGSANVIGAVQSYIVQSNVTAMPGAPGKDGVAVWTVAGGDSRWDYPTSQGTSTLSSGNGSPFTSLNGTTQSMPQRAVRALIVPHLVASLLLKEFLDQNYSIINFGTTTLDSKAVTIVKIESQRTRDDARVTTQIWYFDNQSNLPSRVEYHLPDAKVQSRFMPIAVDLSDYESVSGVLFPSQVITTINGIQIEVLHLASVQMNPQVASSTFGSVSTGGVQ